MLTFANMMGASALIMNFCAPISALMSSSAFMIFLMRASGSSGEAQSICSPSQPPQWTTTSTAF